MNIRNVWFGLLLLATVCSTGCSGMRNFLFGRGARCGLCSRLGAAGQALNPLAPAPAPTAPCNAAPYAPAAPYAVAPPCGAAGGAPAPTVYGGPVCGSGMGGGYAAAMPGGCGCQTEGYPSGAAYYGGTEYVSPGYETVVPGGMIQGDNFQSRNYETRRYDSQGDWIVQEDPMPSDVIVRD